MKKQLKFCLIAIFLFVYPGSSMSADYSIGVYYFPGWGSTKEKSAWDPIKKFPEREPLLGFYRDGTVPVAESHIEFASKFGIDFFIYDWYWSGSNPMMMLSLQSYLKAKNKDKLKFCLLWENSNEVPKTKKEFDDMLNYWLNNYFNQPTYYRVEGRPLIFVYRYETLESSAKKINMTANELLDRANAVAKENGLPGIYFVAVTNGEPSNALESQLKGKGYDAYTGWNYVVAKDKSRVADYDSMVRTYLDFYSASSKTMKQLPYFVPASPGWDSTPWKGDKAYVRGNSIPEKFERMLRGAKQLLDNQKNGAKILIVEAWNEFGEGSYVEPTKKWGTQYLETIQKVFRTP